MEKLSGVIYARAAECARIAMRAATQSAPHPVLAHRRDRVEAPRSPLPLGAEQDLAQDQESGGAGPCYGLRERYEVNEALDHPLPRSIRYVKNGAGGQKDRSISRVRGREPLDSAVFFPYPKCGIFEQPISDQSY